MEQPVGKMPPQDLEAEDAVIGCCCLHRDAVGVCVEMGIVREDFYGSPTRIMWDVLLKMWKADEAIDLVTVGGHLLRSAKTLEAMGFNHKAKDGGKSQVYEKLAWWAEGVPSHVNARFYAQTVKEMSVRRKAITVCSQLTDAFYDLSRDLGELRDEAEVSLLRLDDRDNATANQTMGEAIEEAFSMVGVNNGIRTGFTALDSDLSGLHGGELIVVGGRPSMGKSAFALQAALGVATQNIPTAFYSLEMRRVELIQRALCLMADANMQLFRRGILTDEKIAAVRQAAEDLRDVPLHIDDTMHLSVTELRARARRMVSERNVKMLMVDYLQMMRPNPHLNSRQEQVAEISRGLKALARELNIPVVVLAQLNRGPENRSDQRPRMADLRESGAVEQDADVILLLHREEYYHKADTQWMAVNADKVGQAEVIIDKQRNGPTGVVKLRWAAYSMRFENPEQSAAPAPAPVADQRESAPALPWSGTESSNEDDSPF